MKIYMKNNFMKISFIGISMMALSALMLVSCGKKSEPTAVNTSVKTFTSIVTPQTVTSGAANITGTVTTSDGSAYLKLEVTSPTKVGYVYITSSSDNGAMSPFIPTANFTDSLGNTFKSGSSSYSYTMTNTNNFVLEIPVPIRSTSAAVSDVYVIWFTSGKGSFTLPAQRLTLGPVIFTLNYTANAGPSYSTVAGIVLGDQSATPGSLLVTSGQVSALTTALYDSSATSADLALCALNQTGTTKTNLSSYIWLTSPSLRSGFTYSNEPTNPSPNVSYIATASNSINFNTATGSDLAALQIGSGTSNTSQEVLISNGGLYMFQTAVGKKGLILVTALNINNTSGSTATVSVKVQN